MHDTTVGASPNSFPDKKMMMLKEPEGTIKMFSIKMIFTNVIATHIIYISVEKELANAGLLIAEGNRCRNNRMLSDNDHKLHH